MNEANLQYRVLELLLEQRVEDDTCDLALDAVSGTDEVDAALAGHAPEWPKSGETSGRNGSGKSSLAEDSSTP